MKNKINVLFLVLILAAVFFTFYNSKARRARREDLRLHQYVDATLSKWRTRQTTQIDLVPSTTWKSVPIAHNELLKEDQANILREKARQFFASYKDGDFDAYKSFRLIGNCTLNKARITKIAKSMGIALPDKDPGNALRILFTTICKTNLLEGIDVSSLRLSTDVVTNHDQLIQESLNKEVAGMALIFYPPIVTYSPSAEDILFEQGNILAAELNAFARFQVGSRTPCPIAVTFYWNNDAQSWFPWEFALIGSDLETIF